MKNYHIKVTVILLVLMLGLPSPALFLRDKTDTQPTVPEPPTQNLQSYFNCLDPKTGTITQIPDRDYIIGVVAAEMPASYPVEALKAQAVAAYTVACRRRNAARASGEKSDVSADSSVDQAYKSIDEAAKNWGENAQMYKNKITAAVDSVLGTVLTFEGELADSLFYAISNGKTENAKNVWGNEIPYLKSVDSAGDLTASGYLTTVSLSSDDFKAACEENDIKLPEEKEKWIGAQTLNETGTVKTQIIGDKTLKGTEVRSIFSLRSATFALAFTEDTFTFTVRGFGHGVGMSQYGAKYMAELGATYREILSWYYTGCELSDISKIN